MHMVGTPFSINYSESHPFGKHPDVYRLQFLSSFVVNSSGVARGGFQRFWTKSSPSPLGYSAGYNFKRNEIFADKENEKKTNWKSITLYFKGYIWILWGRSFQAPVYTSLQCGIQHLCWSRLLLMARCKGLTIWEGLNTNSVEA